MFKKLRKLLPYMRKYRARYALGLICLVVVDAAQLLLPRYARDAVDAIGAGAGSGGVAGIALLMVATAAGIALGRFLWRYFIHGSARRIEAEIREDFFASLMSLSSDFFGAQKTGDLMARATNDLHAVRMAAGMSMVSLIDGLFMSMAIIIVLLASYPRVALYVILPLPIISVLVMGFGKLIGKLFKEVQERYSRLSEIAQETMTGIRVVKHFVKEEAFARTFQKANDEYQKSNMRLVGIYGFFFPAIGFLSGLSSVILIAAGGPAVIEGRMSAGELVAVFGYIGMLIWPFLGAGFTVNMLQRGAASMGRVSEVLEAEPSIKDSASARALPGSMAIEIRGLKLRYPGAKDDALKGLSLSMREGEKLGILGRTGSGKSSLLRVLPRLVEAQEGAYFVGGVEAREIKLAALRGAIAYVPQDGFLFSDTIRANVLFGAAPGAEARLDAICKAAGLERDLASFPKGLDTVIGERGHTISGGQKQRVALARALAKDAPLLVMDDPLSAVDVETEARILDGIWADRGARGLILVSHRVSTLSRCERVLVMDEGRVVDEGDHEELVARAGLYRDIWILQQAEGATR
jgi:ATP-binding cassette subfamily B protein